jgi:hypothetical protein
MPFLRDRVEVTLKNTGYKQNGFGFYMRFTGMNQQVPLCEIVSGVEDPLLGNEWTSNSTQIMNYGESLMFEPMGLEFIKTDAQKPQVLVTVNGIVALCSNDNCDYTYTETESIVSSQTLVDNEVTITGSALPISDASIKFGPTSCTVSTSTETELLCTLDEDHVAGEWISQVITDAGVLPNEVAEPITVSHQVDSVSPSTGVNFLGGDILTISGNNFGTDLDAVAVTFADGTICNVKSVEMTSITCKAARFTSDVTSPQDVTVTINNVEDSSLSVEMKTVVAQSLYLSPSSASPVLKTELTVYLSDAFVDIQAADFTATLLKDDDPEFVEVELFVMSADQETNSIKIKFNGARSGHYHIGLHHEVEGTVASEELAIHVHSTINSISPTSGSIYGGALVTISGENFSDEPLDNPVKIGDDFCYVITSSPTEITCRTDPLLD